MAACESVRLDTNRSRARCVCIVDTLSNRHPHHTTPGAGRQVSIPGEQIPILSGVLDRRHIRHGLLIV